MLTPDLGQQDEPGGGAMVDKRCVQRHSREVAPVPGDTGGGHG